jgi:hypothetical protein
MSEYYPDKWVLVKLVSPVFGTVYKILGSWYGGFGGSNAWKLSSGFQDSVLSSKNGKVYTFPQSSGSVYSCHAETYGMSMYTSGILAYSENRLAALNDGSSISVVPEKDIAEVIKFKVN